MLFITLSKLIRCDGEMEMGKVGAGPYILERSTCVLLNYT